MSINNSLNVLGDLDKRWLNHLIILEKVDWLNGRHSLWSLHCKFFGCAYRDFIWFHQPKNHSFNCPANTIYGIFLIVDLAVVPLKLYQSDLLKCVINANTYLEGNCDKHPSLRKMAFFNKSFILFFDSLTMALVQINLAIRERSLDSLIAAIGIFAESPCSASQ